MLSKEWASQFECPVHGNMRVYPDAVTTKKTCLLCDSGLIRGVDVRSDEDQKPPLWRKPVEDIIDEYEIHRKGFSDKLTNEVTKGKSICDKSPVLVTDNHDKVTCQSCVDLIEKHNYDQRKPRL
jgi:hypothetical protein